MKLLTFTGETPAEALKKAQERFGEDALVVNTKEVRKKSLTTPALFELVVGVKDELVEKENFTSTIQKPIKQEQKYQGYKAPPPKQTRDIGRVNEYKDTGQDVLFNISEAAKQISRIANVTNEVPMYKRNISQPKESPFTDKTKTSNFEEKITKNDFKELNLIKGEIAKLTDKIKLIQETLWKEKGPDENLVIPAEFAEIYRLSKQSGMIDKHLDAIMKLTLEHMPLKMRANSNTIKRYFQVLLNKIIPVRNENEILNSNKKIIMLVGPTGVGKTTTLAKLAARYSYMMPKKYKVGIITLDTYRIGAVEQLMQYAKMMRLGIEAVVDPPEFSNAIAQLKHCDYILIDTVGSSQHDKHKIDKLKEFLNGSYKNIIDVNLVVSATAKYEDLMDIYTQFSPLEIDSMIVTKLDETKGFGNVFSMIYENKKPLSYFSVGQEVPNDLMVSESEYLINCLLDGFKRD